MELDLTGLRCPLPTLKARRELMRMAEGERLTVLADDPMAAIDLPHFCKEAGHRLVSFERDGTRLRFLIEAGAPREDASRDDADQPKR